MRWKNFFNIRLENVQVYELHVNSINPSTRDIPIVGLFEFLAFICPDSGDQMKPKSIPTILRKKSSLQRLPFKKATMSIETAALIGYLRTKDLDKASANAVSDCAESSLAEPSVGGSQRTNLIGKRRLLSLQRRVVFM